MKYNVLNEVKRISRQDRINIRTDNSNEYRLLMWNDDNNGVNAYYFSCPIYHQSNRQLIDLKFHDCGGVFVTEGSSAHVKYYNDKILFKGSGDEFVVNFRSQQMFKKSLTSFLGVQRECLSSEQLNIFPTFNGVAFEVKSTADMGITIEHQKSFEKTLENDNFLSFMLNEHLPYIGVNSIIAKDIHDNCYPLKLNSKKVNDKKYQISFNASNRFSETDVFSYYFEVNLYAPKLIYDTTVESVNPDKNNPYGSVAFLGNITDYGEQWLYSRFNPSYLLDLVNYSVEKATLYLPKYNSLEQGQSNILAVMKMSSPWCSFGSTWNTRISPEKQINNVVMLEHYAACDVTQIVKDIMRLKEPANPGIVIKPEEVAEDLYTAIATADNYITPQILELKLILN